MSGRVEFLSPDLFFHNCLDREAHFLQPSTLCDSYFTISNIVRHFFLQFSNVCDWYFKNFKQCATHFFTLLNSQWFFLLKFTAEFRLLPNRKNTRFFPKFWPKFPQKSPTSKKKQKKIFFFFFLWKKSHIT